MLDRYTDPDKGNWTYPSGVNMDTVEYGKGGLSAGGVHNNHTGVAPEPVRGVKMLTLGGGPAINNVCYGNFYKLFTNDGKRLTRNRVSV